MVGSWKNRCSEQSAQTDGGVRDLASRRITLARQSRWLAKPQLADPFVLRGRVLRRSDRSTPGKVRPWSRPPPWLPATSCPNVVKWTTLSTWTELRTAASTSAPNANLLLLEVDATTASLTAGKMRAVCHTAVSSRTLGLQVMCSELGVLCS